MMFKTQLVKLTNTILAIAASYLAAQTFISSTLTNQIFQSASNILSTELNFIVDETTLKTGFLVLVLFYILINLFGGRTHNMMNIFHVDILLIISEVFSHSKFEWLNIFLNINVYNTSKSFTETLFIAVLIVGGYILLLFDSKFRENSDEYTKRGIDNIEIEDVYMNQSIISLTIIVLTFFVIIMISFLIDIMVNLTKPIVFLNNVNYIVFGVLSSILISTTLYIFLNEQSN